MSKMSVLIKPIFCKVVPLSFFMCNVVVLEIIKDQLLGYVTGGVLTLVCHQDDLVEM